MNNKYYHIGIDGGGSHCRARLYAPNGELIGKATAGPANARLETSSVEMSLNSVVIESLKQAGLNRDTLHVTKVGIGLAGILSDSDILRFSNYCELFPHAILQSDSYIACLGAHNGDDGATLVTGTGTSAMLVRGGTARILSSWGFRIADQASGAQMGLMALREALKAHDGIIDATDFSRSLMAQFNNNPTDIVDWSETATPADYAKFAPSAIDASKSRDPIARKITKQCFKDFRDLLDMLINKGARKICLTGGLSTVYRHWLPNHYQEYLREPLGDPIDGAIILAKQITPPSS